MLLFVCVLYKIAVIYLGCTVLIGRIIIGIINWKDCERSCDFLMCGVILPLSGATTEDQNIQNSWSWDRDLNQRLPDYISRSDTSLTRH